MSKQLHAAVCKHPHTYLQQTISNGKLLRHGNPEIKKVIKEIQETIDNKTISLITKYNLNKEFSDRIAKYADKTQTGGGSASYKKTAALLLQSMSFGDFFRLPSLPSAKSLCPDL